MNAKKTLIINYTGLCLGGIERYLNSLILYSLREGHRVIWITTPENYKSADYREAADHKDLEKVFCAEGRRKIYHKLPVIRLEETEEVVMISFAPEDYVWGDGFRKKNKCRRFDHFLILMNFFGFLTFPEDKFKSGIVRNLRRPFSKRIARKINGTGSIRAFSTKQLKAYSDRYDLKMDISEDYVTKLINAPERLSREMLYDLAATRKECLVISTCARFAFPHKGYMIGLIDVYKDLFNAHPNIRLNIVGYGDDEHYLLDKIDELPEEIKSTISLMGKMLPEQLIEVFRQSHLVIGLAGSASTSASVGIPTLVVRHNTLSCEAYGFYHEVETTLDDKPGKPVLPYIESVFNSSNDDYVSCGEAESAEYLSRVDLQPDFVFDQQSITDRPVVSLRDTVDNIFWTSVSLLKDKTKKVK